MLVVVTLMAVVISFSMILLDKTLSTRRAGKAVANEGTALRIAHAGVSKAIYCLNSTTNGNCGGVAGPTYPGESNISFGSGSFTTIVTTVNSTTRFITSTGRPSNGGRAETVLVSATNDSPLDTGIAFNAALVAGTGGIYVYSDSTVRGDMRSRGDILCTDTTAHLYGIPYVSSDGGQVDSCTLHADVHADKVQYSTALRDVYYRCQFWDLYGTTVSGVNYAGATRPSVYPLPVINTSFWRAEALAGGVIEGNYVPANNSSLGPKKINGDLTLNPNSNITLTGTIWVTGDILMNQPSSMTLTSAMQQFGTVVLADSDTEPTSKGKIDIRDNVNIYGSGQATSFILFVSTNTSNDYDNPAIKVDTVSLQAAWLAPYGLVRLRGDESAAALAGQRIYMNVNSTVDFTNTSLNVAKFGSIPPGTWRVLPGTYREQ